MKQIFSFFTAIILLSSCSNDKAKTDGDAAVVKSATAETAAPDSATMMKNWMAYMTPGAEHKMMASWDGEWKAEITMWMSPEAPPTKTIGTTVNKTIFDGRYQQSAHKGSWDGQPFEGMSTLAYDNAKKVFISTWIDNMGTGVMVGEGPWDEATKTISLRGKMVDPSSHKEGEFREVYKVVDENNQVMEMYAPVPGGKGEFRTMEIKYMRSK